MTSRKVKKELAKRGLRVGGEVTTWWGATVTIKEEGHFRKARSGERL